MKPRTAQRIPPEPRRDYTYPLVVVLLVVTVVGLAVGISALCGVTP